MEALDSVGKELWWGCSRRNLLPNRWHKINTNAGFIENNCLGLGAVTLDNQGSITGATTFEKEKACWPVILNEIDTVLYEIRAATSVVECV